MGGAWVSMENVTWLSSASRDLNGQHLPLSALVSVPSLLPRRLFPPSIFRKSSCLCQLPEQIAFVLAPPDPHAQVVSK